MMIVSDIMRRSFATIKPEAPLIEAAHLLLETNQRGLPVVDRDRILVGIISEGDFLHRTELDVSLPTRKLAGRIARYRRRHASPPTNAGPVGQRSDDA